MEARGSFGNGKLIPYYPHWSCLAVVPLAPKDGRFKGRGGGEYE
jgi:hypothetical protein